MSGSFPIFDSVVEQLVGWAAPRGALDIGAGAGKYGRLLQRVAPGCRRAAIEVNAAYVQNLELASLYDAVDVADAGRWWRDNPDEVFDVVIAGDVLQCMPKSDGLDLVNAMVYRCGWLVLALPEFVIQGAHDESDANVHRSVWSERDFAWHDLWAWDNARSITLVVLRGYQASPLTIDDLVRRVNEGAIQLLDYDGHTPVRPCRLRLVDQSREVAYRLR